MSPVRPLIRVVNRHPLAPMMVWLVVLTFAPSQGILRHAYRAAHYGFVPLVFCFFLLLLVEGAIGFLAWFAPDRLPGIWPGRVTSHQGDRLTGTFNHPELYSGALLLFATFGYHWAITHPKGIGRNLSLGAVGLCLASIFLTFSRAGWLGAALVTATGVVVYAGRYFWRTLICGLVVAALLAILFQAEVQYGFERLTCSHTIRSRIVMAAGGWRMFLENPIGGWGYETYDRLDAQRFSKSAGFNA